jgi:hypothetical protein
VLGVLVEETDVRDLRDAIALQHEIRFSHDSLPTAVVRFAVAQMTQGLKDGRFLALPTHTTCTAPVGGADLPAIRSLLKEKTYTYQGRQGRDRLCGQRE